MYDGTPWGYIHQKKKTEEALSEKTVFETENKILKEIVKKLLANKELSESNKTFLKKQGI